MAADKHVKNWRKTAYTDILINQQKLSPASLELMKILIISTWNSQYALLRFIILTPTFNPFWWQTISQKIGQSI